MPVIETGVGNCHVYVDAAADLDKALAIVVNAKTHRTSVCNAAESLLVHADVADVFLPRVVAALQERDVNIHGDEAFATYDGVVPATDEDWGTEYLALEISAAVVPVMVRTPALVAALFAQRYRYPATFVVPRLTICEVHSIRPHTGAPWSFIEATVAVAPASMVSRPMPISPELPICWKDAPTPVISRLPLSLPPSSVA